MADSLAMMGAGTAADFSAPAFDPQRLGSLKGLAKQGDERALRAVAQEFEALLTQQLMKSMRATDFGDEFTASDATRTFTGLLDEQYAQSLSRGTGLGLADMIVRQVREAEGSGVKKPSGVAVKP
jgi:flagellar protein FlgJ